MPGLLQAILTLRETFEQHAKKDGNSSTLTKAELGQLLRSEFPGKGNSDATVDSFFSMLDDDRSGHVDFKEFVTFVVSLATMMGK